MNHKAQRLTGLALLLIIASLLLLAGCNIPFLPRHEIDSFPMDAEMIDTMEVQGIRYTRVINPEAADDPAVPASIWVPASAYQSGKYQLDTKFLPQAAENHETADANSANKTPAAAAPPASSANDGNKTTATDVSEKELQEKLKVNLPLRRRVLIFPSQVSIKQPQIISLLSSELEERLPLRVDEITDPALLQSGRLLLNRDEMSRAARKWLKNQPLPTPFQFLLFINSSTGRNFRFYTCTWIDAQTGNQVAVFTFRANLKGRLLLPLVPNNPTPLQRLLDSTSWWCKIMSRPEDSLYLLEAGHRSDLDYGRKLMVFRKAAPIRDPRNRKRLGFLFEEPLGEVHVVDFFAADGSLAQARIPLKTGFKEAWAVAIPVPKTKPVTKTSPQP